MKYFLDTEFLEGKQRYRRAFWEALTATRIYTNPTIDLISIGIVAEDGREYYAISKEFNLREAWNRYDLKLEGNNMVKVFWVRDNVLLPIYLDKVHGDMRNVSPFSYSAMKGVIEGFGKTNKKIAEEIIEFINSEPVKQTGTAHTVSQLKEESVADLRRGYLKPEFYGYYASYDWVVFCWMFGKMLDLPKGFPMYCRDIKQELDRKVEILRQKHIPVLGYPDPIKDHGRPLPFKEALRVIKDRPDYPKETNAHNALSDAKWNKELYDFIQKL